MVANRCHQWRKRRRLRKWAKNFELHRWSGFSVRPLEMRDVGAGRKRDAELVGVTGFLVILCDALAYFGGGHSNDGIGSSVVRGVASKDFYPEGSLLKELAAAFEFF